MYKKKIILFVTAFLIIPTLYGIIFADNMLKWSSYYSKINVILILLIFIWIYFNFCEYIKTKNIKMSNYSALQT